MIRRAPNRHNYTVISNHAANDERLSFQAKGMLYYLLSKPDNWQISREHLSKVCTNGIASVRAILAELEKYGYIIRERKAGEHGRFEWECTVYEEPQSPSAEKQPMDSPSAGKPSAEKPPVENRMLINTDVVKTEVVSTEYAYNARVGASKSADPFLPEELVSEPLPPSAPKRQQEREKAEREAKRLELIAAFRHVRFGKPRTDAVPPAEYAKMRQAADDLIAAGATPAEVEQATNEALLRASDDKYVTLRAVAGSLTELLTPSRPRRAPAPRPSAPPRAKSPVGNAYGERIASNRAAIDAMFDELDEQILAAKGTSGALALGGLMQ